MLTGKNIFEKILFVSLFAILFACPKLYPGGGPAQPEAAQFEPVDATDLVNLATGDFVYNLPLLEVPGPEGNWPINMSYHAGVGPNTEATWVGLGWTLNPGSINRFISGYPDDYWNGNVQTTYNVEPKRGWGVGIGVSYGPVGMNMNYDSQTGFGMNMNISLVDMIALAYPVADASNIGSLGGGARFDVGLQVGTSGVGLSTSLGIGAVGESGIGASLGISAGVHSSSKPSAGIGGGLSYYQGKEKDQRYGNSMSLIGVSYSAGNQGANFSVAGTGFQSMAKMEGSGHFVVQSSSFFLPIGFFCGAPGLGISISYYEWEWWLKEMHNDRSFGTLHLGGYFATTGTSCNDYNLDKMWKGSVNGNIYDDAYKYLNDESKAMFVAPENQYQQASATFSVSSTSSDKPYDIFVSTKAERRSFNGSLFPSEDIYLVNGQGISGIFSPFYENSVKYIDNWEGSSGALGNPTAPANFYGQNIKFRFLGDQGGNFISKTSYSASGITNYESIASNKGSRKIEPAIELETGQLVGFRITMEDGKIYEYFRAVNSYYQYTETIGDGSSSTNTMISPYATSWLLTSVKGPDYVDRTSNGFSSDDYGFWVHFIYENTNKLVAWRTPFDNNNNKKTNTPGTSNKTYSKGLRDQLYLKYIETTTHLANFISSTRNDNDPSQLNSIEIPLETSSYIHSDGKKYLKIKCNIDKKFILKFISENNINIRLYGGKIENWEEEIYQYICELEWYKDADNKDVYGTHCEWQWQWQWQYNEENTETVHNLASIKLAEVVENNSWTIMTNLPLSTIQFPDELHKRNRSKTESYYAGKLELIGNPVLNTEKFAMKLNSIELYRKILDANQKTDYKATINTPIVPSSKFESIHFGYDYSLVKGSENSNSNNNNTIGDAGDGKLTLKSITKKRNGVNVLPPTLFEYNGYNTPWGEDKWDYWNGYTSEGTADFHFRGQNLTQANSDASTWNLSRIITPQGSSIEIEYESDLIDFVKNSDAFISHKEYPIPINPDPSSTVYIWNGDLGYMENARQIDNFFVIAKITKTTLFDHNTNDELYARYNLPNKYEYSCRKVNSINVTTREVTLAGTSSFPGHNWGPSGIIPDSYKIPDNQQYGGWWRGESYEYYIYPRQKIYSGHRVKSISLNDGNKLKKTNYKYGYGVTAVFPESYKKSLPRGYDTQGLLSCDKYNELGPSPSVVYDKIEVIETDDSGKALFGKTIHSFYTAKDVNETKFETQEITVGSEKYVSIKDYSGRIGQLKSVEINGLKPGMSGDNSTDYFKVSENIFSYANSYDLNGSGRTIKSKDGITLSNNQPLGLIQQRNASSIYVYNNDYWNSKNNIERPNVYSVGTTTTTYFYDNNNYNSPKSVTSTMTNLAYDALSGKVIMTQTTDSKNNKVISETVPAYWKYPEMENKNMLSQIAETKGYLIPQNVTITDIKNDAAFKQYITSASVTTWKNWGLDAGYIGIKGIWRQDDTYQWIGTTGSTTFYDFYLWTGVSEDGSGDFVAGKSGSTIGSTNDWKRTSNITDYDRYGHPIEERGLDGQYTTSMYGYDEALPVYIVNNARRSKEAVGIEAGYIGFESGSYAPNLVNNDYWSIYAENTFIQDANTGKYSVKVGAITGQRFGPTRDFLPLPFNMSQFKKYVYSAWIKTEAGYVDNTASLKLHTKKDDNNDNAPYPGISAASKSIPIKATNGKWVYYEAIIDLNEIRSAVSLPMNLRIRCFIDNPGSKYILIDDIRFHPVDSDMSTFVYDPDTWQVTAITDANNVTTYYEYDKAGRLWKVYDQDRNLISKYNYNYGRQ